MASPLVQWTLGYLVGVGLADALRPSLTVTRGLCLGGILLFILVAAFLRSSERGLPLLAGGIGLWAMAQVQAPTLPMVGLPAAWSSEPNRPWILHGVVREEARQLANASMVPLSVSAVGGLAISDSAARDHTNPRPFWRAEPPVAVDVFVDGALPEPFLPGDTLRIAASLRPASGQRPDGDRIGQTDGAPIRAYAPAAGVLRIEPSLAAAATTEGRRIGLRQGLVRIAAQARRALARAQHAAWQRLPRSLQTSQPSPASLAALQQALSLGDRGPLRLRDAERSASGLLPVSALLRQSGVYHILSVSGLHLSVVGLTFYALCRWLSRRTDALCALSPSLTPLVAGRWAALVTLPIVVFYALLTGAESPTVRAAIALSAMLIAVGCGRRARLSTGLALAALWSGLPLGPDTGPQSLFSPSLVLSFAATLGIAYLHPLLGLRAIGLSQPAAPVEDACDAPPRWWRLTRRALATLLRLCDASLAALLATTPLLAYYFAEFQGGALLGNLLVTPLAEFVLLPCGLLTALVALIHPALAWPFIAISSLAGRLMLALAAQVTALGLGCPVAAPSRLVLGLWYVGLCLSPRRRRLGPSLVVAAMLIYLLPGLASPRALRLSFLDVGQGDAAVAELPGGAVVVIDTGWPTAAERANASASPHPTPLSTHFSAGTGEDKAPVGTFLQRRGHRRIDLLVISHRHPDHMGGAASLLRQFSVDVLWLNRQPATAVDGARQTALAAAEAELLQLARARGTLVAVPHSIRLSGIAIDVLGPCPATESCRTMARGDWDENDNSLVVALRYAGRSVLMTGDIEEAAETALIRGQAALRADVLKLPHHGSRTSSSEEFLQAVAPQHAIASLGRQNRFGFPHPQVVHRLAERQIPLWRTDRDGTVLVEIDARGSLRLSSQQQLPTLTDYLGSR